MRGLALLFAVLLAAPLLSAQLVPVQRKPKLNPYQQTLKACLSSSIDVAAIDTHKKLYKAIESFYPLLTTETVYREVRYRQKGELKKLRFENGVIQVFDVDDEENLTQLSSERIGDGAPSANNILRHRPLSAEARIQQLLIRADILSDFSKVKEVRAGKLSLTISWADAKIKSLQADFAESGKSLNCSQKETADICSCS